ncbi:hypothetical protein [Pseudofrankia sp. BMG5.36]|uniref:hypothetical protein n=1 Tax=Pseudofrankia sp. BMG5.36 TaxID=1834512 RepID=UPI001F51A008|nr:hypothetical protein [Pseudofrankia sp. BMG5.36]
MFRIGLPAHDDAHRGPTVFQKLVPTSYHADNTLVFTCAGQRVYAVVIEVQLRWVPKKWLSWKIYAASLEKELGVGVILAVFCPEIEVAAKYRGLSGADKFSVRLWPYVLSPGDLPLVEEAVYARANIALAALSLVCHGGDDPATLEPSFAALYEAMHEVDWELARRICDMLFAGLSKAARARWEEHMTVVDSEYRSELFREIEARGRTEGLTEGRTEGRAEGMAKAKADAVLRILSQRGVPVPDVAQEKIRSCTDLDLLDTWLDRVLTATSAEDVIAPPSRGARRVDL